MDEPIATWASMYEQGMSCQQIVDHFRLPLSHQSVRKYLRANGVVIRGKNEYPHPVECQSCHRQYVRSRSNQIHCKECIPDRAWQIRYQKYGVTKYDCERKKKAQGGRCPICTVKLPDDWSQIHIDHCHKQGHTRGLLHRRCNIALAYIEDARLLSNALRYVKAHER